MPDTVFTEDIVKFIDSTENAETWIWDFGDDYGKSTDRNPEYLYKSQGSYTVTLNVNNKFSAQKTITVKPRPITPQKINQASDWTRDTTSKIKVLTNTSDKYNNGSSGKVSSGSTNSTVLTKTVVKNVYTQTVEMYNIPYDKRPIKYGGGDGDYGGHILISGRVELEISPDRKKVFAAVYAEFIENGGWKNTQARIDGNIKSGQIELEFATTGKIIKEILTDKKVEYFYWSSPKGNHAPKFINYDSFVHRIELYGDTEGKEFLKDGTTKCLFRIYFNDFKIRLTDE